MSHNSKDKLFTKRYLRQSDLIPDILPFSSATLWRKVKAGEFIKPVKLSERITAWESDAVSQWLDAQKNGGCHD